MSSGIVESSQSGPEQQPQQNQPISRTRLVQRLLASTASLPNFVHDLILTQAHIVAGTEAAAFLIEASPEAGAPGDAGAAGGKKAYTLKPIAHIRPDESDAQTRAAALEAFQEIMRPCIEQGKDGAIQIDGTNDGSESQFCLITLLRNEGNVVAASAVITRARDGERAQKLLTPMQLVAGYFDLFTLRRRDEQSRTVAQSHQHVLQLATAVATADGFESAAMNLCNELAARTGAARVSVGWLKGDTIRLKALSHTEEFDKKQELSVQLVKVMEECLDNDEIVQFDPDGTSSNTVTREAQILSRSQAGETILSLPLRRKGEVVGVATLEFAANQKISPQAATGLAVAVELLAPQLYDRYQNDRWLITKAGLSIQDMAKKAAGPTHMLAKTVVTLVIAALLFLILYRPMYHVSAPFEFAPVDKRTFSAPFDGQLRQVLAKPGDHVKKGQPLLKFDDSALQQKYLQALYEAEQNRDHAMQYRADPTKSAERAASEAAQRSAEAEAAFYKTQIDTATISAPFDGEILGYIGGDLEYKQGATFKLGEPLMEMAQRDSLKAKLTIAERDIQDISVNSKGTIAVSSAPTDKFPITVERIVPLGQAKDGSNVFTAYAALNQSSERWVPGMAGEARIDVSHRSLAWIWTHRFVDFVRMKLWF